MKIYIEKSKLIESRKAEKRITTLWLVCCLALGCFAGWYSYTAEMAANDHHSLEVIKALDALESNQEPTKELDQ